MKETAQIKLLEKIKKVEAPPFLYTRIEAQIDAIQQNRTPLKWVAISTTAFCLLLLINFSVLNACFFSNQNTDAMHNMADEMDLITDSQLYYD